MAKILVLAEHNGATLDDATARLVGAATQFDGEIDILVAGVAVDDVAARAAMLDNVAQVHMADNAALRHQLAEPMAQLVSDLAVDYEFILTAASSNGGNILPRVAAKLDIMPVTGVVQILNGTQFVRPIYAGKALQRVESLDNKRLISVRVTSFDPVGTNNNASINAINADITPADTRFVTRSEADPDYVDLGSARRVVSGGRALGSTDAFDSLINPLASILGAAKGATRAAVDAGYVANDWQVGQTGRVVAPELYFAIGISGAVQHTAGMSGSKVIVAINQDPEAPIFEIADYGLVGDLFEIVPQLQAALEAHLAQ